MAFRALALLCPVLVHSTSEPTVDVPCGSLVPTLDFENAEIVNNNLGGAGPNLEDPEEILYGNLGKLNDGTAISLKVTKVGDYEAANSGNNGVHNGMGQINVAGDSTAKLKFEFIDSDGNELCLGNAGITFYDVDGGNHEGDNQQYEVISVCPAADAIVLSDNYNHPNNVATDLEETTAIDGCKAWKSEAPISNVLDPTDPDNLNDEQLSHTLTYLWNDLCSFDVFFSSVNGAPSSGRNFWFTGLGEQTNECPTTTAPDPTTTAPDPSPSPTPSPSPAPTTAPDPTTTAPDPTTTRPELGVEPCEGMCALCDPGDTCVQAIACKFNELTSGFDSNDNGELTEDQCNIALQAVVESCPVCEECETCITPLRLLDDSAGAGGSGAAAERGSIVAALAVASCLLAAVSGAAAALAGLRRRASQPLAVATESGEQSETDGQQS